MSTVGNNLDDCLNCNHFVDCNIENNIQIVLIFLNQGTMRSRVPQQSMYLREAKRRRIRHESVTILTQLESQFTRLIEQIQIQICYRTRLLRSK